MPTVKTKRPLNRAQRMLLRWILFSIDLGTVWLFAYFTKPDLTSGTVWFVAALFAALGGMDLSRQD